MVCLEEAFWLFAEFFGAIPGAALDTIPFPNLQR